MSIPTYLLLYLSRRNPTTQEAATKYFFLSIFASALLLYGLAFLYGTTGISNLKALAYLIERLPNIPQAQLGLLALVFVLAGLCFRVAAVPLHFYAPDVYQGSPIVIAAFLSWVPKAVGFLAIIRALIAVLSVKGPEDPLVQKAILLAWIIAAATMIWGNFVALLQENLKRLLAYSSIAHAGYLMVGVAAAFANDRAGNLYYGSESIFFYLVVYAFMTLGAFGVISALKIKGRNVESVEELAGLGFSRPLPALGLSICLLSLSGIPPLAGFWGKFEIFAAALAAQRRDENGSFLLLAIIGMLSAAVGGLLLSPSCGCHVFPSSRRTDRSSRGLACRLRSGFLREPYRNPRALLDPASGGRARPPNRPWPTRIPAWPWLPMLRNRQRFDHFVRNAIDRTTAESVSWGS